MTTTDVSNPSQAGPVPMPVTLEKLKRQAFEEGKTDCRENRHENPYPYRSELYFAWQRGHSSISCDECSGRRTQLCCPQCNSYEVETHDFTFAPDRQTGYDDHGTRAECKECHFKADVEDFDIPCVTCNATGVDPSVAPNYLGEAFKIAAGESEAAVSREHLIAVVEYARKFVAAAMALPEIGKVA